MSFDLRNKQHRGIARLLCPGRFPSAAVCMRSPQLLLLSRVGQATVLDRFEQHALGVHAGFLVHLQAALLAEREGETANVVGLLVDEQVASFVDGRFLLDDGEVDLAVVEVQRDRVEHLLGPLGGEAQRGDHRRVGAELVGVAVEASTVLEQHVLVAHGKKDAGEGAGSGQCSAEAVAFAFEEHRLLGGTIAGDDAQTLVGLDVELLHRFLPGAFQGEERHAVHEARQVRHHDGAGHEQRVFRRVVRRQEEFQHAGGRPAVGSESSDDAADADTGELGDVEAELFERGQQADVQVALDTTGAKDDFNRLAVVGLDESVHDELLYHVAANHGSVASR